MKTESRDVFPQAPSPIITSFLGSDDSAPVEQMVGKRGPKEKFKNDLTFSKHSGIDSVPVP